MANLIDFEHRSMKGNKVVLTTAKRTRWKYGINLYPKIAEFLNKSSNARLIEYYNNCW